MLEINQLSPTLHIFINIHIDGFTMPATFNIFFELFFKFPFELKFRLAFSVSRLASALLCDERRSIGFVHP